MSALENGAVLFVWDRISVKSGLRLSSLLREDTIEEIVRLFPLPASGFEKAGFTLGAFNCPPLPKTVHVSLFVSFAEIVSLSADFAQPPPATPSKKTRLRTLSSPLQEELSFFKIASDSLIRSRRCPRDRGQSVTYDL